MEARQGNVGDLAYETVKIPRLLSKWPLYGEHCYSLHIWCRNCILTCKIRAGSIWETSKSYNLIWILMQLHSAQEITDFYLCCIKNIKQRHANKFHVHCLYIFKKSGNWFCWHLIVAWIILKNWLCVITSNSLPNVSATDRITAGCLKKNMDKKSWIKQIKSSFYSSCA